MYCKKCGTEVSDSEKFCSNCGEKMVIDDDIDDNGVLTSENEHKDGDDDKKSPGFANAVKDDFANSKSLVMVKDQAKKTVEKLKQADSRTKKILAGIVGAVMLLIIIISVATNVHYCDYCDKRYIGKEYHISGLFDSYNVCRDCYRENGSGLIW